MTSEAYLRVTDTLSSSGSKSNNVRQNHSMWQCPAHEDRNPSLAVDDKGDKVAVHCHAGCPPDEVLRALSMEFRDLFDAEPESTGHSRHHVRSYVYKRSNGEPWIIVDRWWPKGFSQRLPGTEPGDTKGLQGREPILYRADKVWACMKAGDCQVWLVEGEKDVEECERQGLTATTTLGGAGKWRDSYTQFLRSASEVVIVADQDAIKPDGTLGSGQQHAVAARNALKAAGVKVKIVAPAVGKDASDHFAAGYTARDFKVEPTASTRPRGMDAETLMAKEFEPIAFAVDKILPAGLTICAGSPKAGKSWLALDLCLAVAMGGPALSGIPTTQGSALYLAREDSYRRLQSRAALIMGGTMEGPRCLELVPQEHDWPGGEEGLANLAEWAEEVENPRLVVIDTLAKVEPSMGEESNQRGGNAYSGNYSMMARYKAFADQHNLSLLMIHHDRKQPPSSRADVEGGMASDPFSRISGTRGLTGAADTLWFLESVRGEKQGYLHITGRDVVEQTVDLIKTGPLWLATHLPE